MTIEMTFVLGNGTPQSARPVSGPQTGHPAQKEAPAWFTRMDRNGDGDVTIKEFLGDKKQFQVLDTNQDGFIEPKEAEAEAASP